MKKMSIFYGKDRIQFEVIFSERKTMEIAVHPDSSVLVKVPQGTNQIEIEQRLKKRARWIQRQQAYFSQFEPRTLERRYIAGETHLYLGKQYRLKIQEGNSKSIKLKNGYFYIILQDLKNQNAVKVILDEWYVERAYVKFQESFDQFWSAFNNHHLVKPTLKIMAMKRRWGSLTSKGTLTLNRDLIRAPRECIDYVIVHELCHLIHQNHSPEFYSLLIKVLPDWEKRKHRLEMALF